MPTLLITGANRGLGLEFVRQYAADGWRVIAACRKPDTADDLRAVSGDVRVETLDVSRLADIQDFTDRLGQEALDLLICNAGVMGPRQADAGEWLKTLAVNSVAPTMLALALADRMVDRGKIVAITSQMGSIADNGSGGFIAYRSSKAALNAAWRSLAIDWRDRPLTVAMLHPGWVQTDMGGGSAPVTPCDSIAGMRRVIDGLTPDRSGSFLSFTGATIPW